MMQARAIEIGFRHLAAPVRRSFAPSDLTLDGAVFPSDAPVLLSDRAAPSWSANGPTGFDFSYAVPEAERQALAASGWYGVVVKLYRVFETSPDVWVEQTAWRFEGRVTDARWNVANGRLDATATPWSRMRQARPNAPSWSNREQIDLTDGADTLLRWTRAARRTSVPIPEV